MNFATTAAAIVMGCVSSSAAQAPAERVVGPSYTVDPDTLDRGQPTGSRFTFEMPLRGSASIFNGSDPCLDPKSPAALWRLITVNIPAGYTDGVAAPLLIVQDGGSCDSSGVGLLDQIDHAQSNLAANAATAIAAGGHSRSRWLPAFITVAVANGGGSERSLEYVEPPAGAGAGAAAFASTSTSRDCYAIQWRQAQRVRAPAARTSFPKAQHRVQPLRTEVLPRYVAWYYPGTTLELTKHCPGTTGTTPCPTATQGSSRTRCYRRCWPGPRSAHSTQVRALP